MALILDGTTGIVANNIADYAISTAKLANSAVTSAKIGYAGAVLQVVQTNLTTSYTASMGGNYVWSNISGLSLSITPTSTSSKILVSAVVQNGTNNGGTWMFRIARNGTGIGVGTTSADMQTSVGTWTFGTYPAYTLVPCAWQHLDSPSTTSAITYAVQIGGDMGTATCYLNRRENDLRFSCVSSITAMEIAG